MIKIFSSARIFVAGFFMGMANLVPGVSGGTMVLALGLYDEFIRSFAEITRFKFSKRNLSFLGTLFTISFTTILLFASVIQFLMESYRPQMLGLFIGLTLGGVPLLYKMVKPLNLKSILGVCFGLLIMGGVTFGLNPGAGGIGIVILFIGGVIGSSAMILPGISGSYLLLILGLYLPIITAISDFTFALKSFDVSEIISLATSILIPFTLGLIVGIIALSNILNLLLKKQKIITQSVLLGFLIGSLFGLYPFALPSFDKLTKYSFVQNNIRTLNIKVVGLDRPFNKLSKNLRSIEDFKIKVNTYFLGDKVLFNKDFLINLKDNRDVLMIYGSGVKREFKIMAKKMKVHLFIIPDVRINIVKVITCFLLLLSGFLITLNLGKMKS